MGAPQFLSYSPRLEYVALLFLMIGTLGGDWVLGKYSHAKLGALLGYSSGGVRQAFRYGVHI